VALCAAAVAVLAFGRPGPLLPTASLARVPRTGAAVPAADPAIIPIVLSERLPTRLPAAGVPAGWHLREFAGQADIELVRDERLALRLRSHRAAYVLYRDVAIDVHTHPWISWSWKIVQLPPGADVRAPRGDDQAAQLYVVFPRWPDPRHNSDVIGYVWDTTAPVDSRAANRLAPNVKVIVVASGPGRPGAWHRFERNIDRDYVALFGRAPTRAGKVGVMIDSNDTRSDAEALVADIQFARAQTEKRETPTPMLR
jgi:Protein of unknown function (DUF3047)